MNHGNLFLGILFFLGLETGMTIGYDVIYNISSPDCGNVGLPIMMKRSISLRPYGIKIGDKSSIVFEVKAAEEVGIYALDSPYSVNATSSYVIFMRTYGNTLNRIQYIWNGNVITTKEFPASSLDPDNYRPFWFSWDNGVIQAGKGSTVGQSTMMTWTAPNPFIVHGIGVGTCWGETAEWRVRVEVEDGFTGRFSKCQMSNTRSDLPIIATYSTSKSVCAVNCASDDNCFGFNHHLTNNWCELLSHGTEPVTSIMRRVMDGWNFYAKCYEGKGVCVGCYL